MSTATIYPSVQRAGGLGPRVLGRSGGRIGTPGPPLPGLSRLKPTFAPTQERRLAAPPSLTVLATDDFARADENPLAGNWTYGTTNKFQLLSGSITPVSPGGGGDIFMYYNAVVWPNDHWTEWRVTTAGTGGGDQGPCLSVRVGATSFYRVAFDHASANNFTFARWDAPTYLQLGGTETLAWSDGDTFRLEVTTPDSSTVRLKLFRNSFLIATRDDTSAGRLLTGNAGGGYSAVATGTFMTAWRGGSLAAPTGNIFGDATIQLGEMTLAADGTSGGTPTPTPQPTQLYASTRASLTAFRMSKTEGEIGRPGPAPPGLSRFRPSKAAHRVSPAGGVPVTEVLGALAVTLDGSTLVADGFTGNTRLGAAAITLAGSTVAATGTVLVQGTADIVLAGTALSSVGTAPLPPTVLLQWPATLPTALLLESFQEAFATTRLRTEMEAGLAVMRNRTTAGVEMVSGQLSLTKAQVQTFDTFFTTTLGHGALRFYWQHPRTLANVPLRFAEAPTYEPITPQIWRAKVQLEVLPT